MPYINTEKRKHYLVRPLNEVIPFSSGDLNYCITVLCQNYMTLGDYKQMNDVLGALEGAKQEFYRRVVVPYEGQKKDQNGDVYETDAR